MNIVINDHRKIFSIQEDFNSFFPYLKLEFYSEPGKLVSVTVKKLLKNNNRTLGECRTIHKPGNITITPNMTVTNLDRNFQDIYGLGIKIYRKSGKAWLETTLTDNWTLEEQNLQGEALSNTKI